MVRRTAAHHLVRVPVVGASATAAEARAIALRKGADGLHVYCVDEQHRLAGLVNVTTLLGLGPAEAVAHHLEPAPPTVLDTESQERVAHAAIRFGLSAVPVASADGRFLGVVPAVALLRVLHFEHQEDLDRLSGVLRRVERVTHAFDEPPSRRVIERLPWLLVGLAGSALATWVMAEFEAVLERQVAVAYFVPGIVYLADAIGTQTEAVAVRSLTHQTPNGVRVFLGEFGTGTLLGLALALPVIPAVTWAFDNFRLALAVGVAITVAGAVAAVVGFAFPLLLSRYGRDPALGSGPLATVFQDVLSLLAYFASVQLLRP